jgi:hypothetical protein
MVPFASNLKPNLVDDDTIALACIALERESQQCLILVRPIRLSRIEERHAEFDRAVDGGDGFCFVALFERAIRLGHPHQAEAEG